MRPMYVHEWSVELTDKMPLIFSCVCVSDTTSVSSTASYVQLSTTTSGSSSVSSSGYRSPSVINLDSPSPPISPCAQRQDCNQTPIRSSCMMASTPPIINYQQAHNNMAASPLVYNNIGTELSSFLDIDDSNSTNCYFPPF